MKQTTYSDVIPEKALREVAKKIVKDKEKSKSALLTTFNCTDMGNAKRLVWTHGTDLRYCYHWKKWLVWDGRRWVKDDTGEVFRRAKETVQGIYEEAAAAVNEETRKELAKHAVRSESEVRIKAMVSLAESELGIPVTPDQLDVNPWLLNCQNGTLDLRTGELREHQRGDMLTNLAPVAYQPDARSDLWEVFLNRVLPDPDVRAFIRQAAGYSLTGLTTEEVLFFPFGPTATGKSTFLAALAAVLGDYSATADFEAFLAREHVTGSPRNDIARLAGRRLVVSIEVDDGRRLAEGLIKMLTGGDVVTARFLRQESFEFIPVFKLWLSANYRPKVRSDDDAVWRRIVQIPFNVQIPEEERDPEMKMILRDPAKSGAAILAWAVKGCLAWQKYGMEVPEAVKETTEEYREEMDPLADFLEECCIVNPLAKAKNTDLWRSYETWARDNGEKYTLGRKRFAQEIARRGFIQGRGRDRFWEGIGIINTRHDGRAAAAGN